MDKVVFIMSVYKNDVAQDLYSSLLSIKNQTYKNTSLCLCKDGPLPNELEMVIDNFKKEYNDVHIIVNNHNLGLAKSLNNMIDYVINRTGAKYIARMDSDDRSRNNRIETQVEYIKKHGLHVCGSFCKEFGASYALDIKSVPIKNDDIYDTAISRCPFIHPTVVFDKEVFQLGVRYPEDTSFTEDMALWFKLIEKKMRLGNVPEVLLDYRLNENTIKRRLGWKKGYCEFILRLEYMVRLNRVSFLNCIKILTRLPFHLMPVFIIKLLYKYGR